MAYKDKEKAKTYYAKWQREFRKRVPPAKRPRRPKTDAQKVKIAEAARSRYARVGYKDKGYPAPSRPRPVICECCGKAPTGRQSLCLDHDHATHKFRGWLCSPCNRSIGMLGDNLGEQHRGVVDLR